VPQSPVRICRAISTRVSEKVAHNDHRTRPLLGELRTQRSKRELEEVGDIFGRQWIQNYQLPDIQIGTRALESRVLLDFMEGDKVA
jgi:hypothetical protein